MQRSLAGTLLSLVLACAGCVPLQQFIDPDSAGPGPSLVPTNPFGSPGPQTPSATVNSSPAATELSLRVDMIGHKLLDANKELGLQPLFATYSQPQPEIFHRGQQMVDVTDGLVKQCKTEAELAAVLAMELAKMVSEREALAHPRTRRPDNPPPIDVPIGNAAQPGAFDGARMAELAHYDKMRREAGRPAPPPDPLRLAAAYLEKAGYPRTSLDAVQPLLDAAEANYVLEKQYRTHGMANWAPPPTP